MDVDREFQVIVCGRKRAVVQSIMQDHGVNLYFPSPLCGDFAPFSEDALKTVLISGKPSAIAKAKDILQASLKSKVPKCFMCVLGEKWGRRRRMIKMVAKDLLSPSS
jgi:hypothetical protein